MQNSLYLWESSDIVVALCGRKAASDKIIQRVCEYWKDASIQVNNTTPSTANVYMLEIRACRRYSPSIIYLVS